MLSTFGTGLGSKLADKWIASVLSPAFIFWLGGFLAWAGGRHDVGFGAALTGVVRQISPLSTTLQVLLVIVGLLTVTVSGVAVQALVPFALRTLEGYWPRPFHGVKHFLTERRSRRLEADATRWRELALKQDAAPITTGELDEYANLDRKRRLAPLDSKMRMPTRLGNLLRAMETRPLDHYGLDAIVCWPRLWLILPEQARKEVTESRRVLDQYAEIWIWSVLFLGWTYFSWWVPLVAIAVALLAYRGMTTAATTYGDLVESCYDLHRFTLYTALKWPPPASPATELADGVALTTYLSRGLAPRSVTFAAASTGPHEAAQRSDTRTTTTNWAVAIRTWMTALRRHCRFYEHGTTGEHQKQWWW